MVESADTVVSELIAIEIIIAGKDADVTIVIDK